MPRLPLIISYDNDTEVEQNFRTALETDRIKGSLSPTYKEQIQLLFNENQLLIQEIEEESAKIEEEIAEIDESFISYSQMKESFVTELITLTKFIDETKKSELENGLRSIEQNIKSKSITLTNYNHELTEYQKLLKESKIEALTYKKSYQDQKGAILLHFGISTPTMTTEHGTKLIQHSLQNKSLTSREKETTLLDQKIEHESSLFPKLHPLEVFLIRKAITELTLDKSVNRALLIDIFAREKGAIKEEVKKIEGRKIKTEKPEAHTVVLYFQPSQNQILIIDPSNSKFSQHICDNDSIILKEPYEIVNMVKCTTTQNQSKGKDKDTEYKIYTIPQGKDHSSDPNDYRDCIDIALKLAFRLNYSQELINPKEIDQSETVLAISNQSIIIENILNIKQFPFRVKQASDIELSKQVNELLSFVKNQYKIFKTLGHSTLTQINDRIEKFKEPYSYEDYQKALINFTMALHQNDKELAKIYKPLDTIVGKSIWEAMTESLSSQTEGAEAGGSHILSGDSIDDPSTRKQEEIHTTGQVTDNY